MQIDSGIAGKAAIVTGGSRGIGRAIVERLAADGADVTFFYRDNAAAADAVVAALRLWVPATSLGAGRADCSAHAPDENIRIADLVTAARITGRFIDAFARLPEVPRVP